MALPRAVKLVLAEKSNSDGTRTNMRFEVASSETDSRVNGSIHVQMPDAFAADFTLNTGYTMTFTAT